jgi:hypothetical protein
MRTKGITMKLTFLTTVCLAAFLQVMPATAATLSATASVTPDAGLYDYSYAFSVTGSGSVDNVFLGSDDLSPLNIAIKFDGATTADWSWLGNDTPSNYLQFFNQNGGSLSAGDTLDVTFTSAFAPGSGEYAIGENSLNSATTNEVAGLLGPMPATAPEPASFGLFLIAVSAATGMLLRRKK